MFMLFLFVFGCSEPIPINAAPTNLTTDIPREPPQEENDESKSGGKLLDRNSSGCRTTQFWASSSQEGKTVNIRGEMLNEGEFPVPFLIDVVSVEKSAVVFGVECAKNHFSFDTPQDLGEVWFFVFADLDGSGPSKSDPQGRSDGVTVSNNDIEGIQVQIYKDRPVEEAYLLGPPNKGDEQQNPPEQNQPEQIEQPQENPAK
jgi:hypothetical protein